MFCRDSYSHKNMEQQREEELKKYILMIGKLLGIENPMNTSYREAYAWALGFDMGYKAAKGEQDVIQNKQ